MHKFSIVWLFQALICLRFCSSHQLSKRGDVAHVNNDSGKSKSKGLLEADGLLGGSESSGGNPGGYGSGGGLPIVGGLTQGLPLVGGLTNGALGGASSAGGLPLIGSLTHGLPLVGSLTNGVLGGAGSTGGLPLVGGLTRGLPLVGDVTNGLLGGGGSGGIPGTPVSDGQNVNQVPGADGDAPWSLPSQAYGQGIECPRGVTAPRGVVLLVPGTGLTGPESYAKSPYASGLPGLGFAYCWISLPGSSTADMQLSGELVAHAIKSLAQSSGRRISILTYSQGGTNVQWALTFWPSIRPMVASFVALAPPTRGSASGGVLCTASLLIGGCLPAIFQESTGSNYMRALNSGEGGRALVSTTIIYSLMDEIVIPQTPQSVSTLPGASNILIQDVCGVAHVVDHFTMPADMGVYGVVIDAFLSERPADPATINRSYCSQLADSLGYSVAGLPSDLKAVYKSLVGNLSQRTGMILQTLTTLRTSAEPLLQPYVCQRGLAVSCGPPGFSQGDNSKFLLNDLPLLGAVGGLLGGH